MKMLRRRMLALSVIDELVRLDDRGTWTHYMSNQVPIHSLPPFSRYANAISVSPPAPSHL